MTKQDKLHTLIIEFRNAPTDANAMAIESFLKTNTLYFNYYFKDTLGLAKVEYASNIKGNGKFIDFTISENYRNSYDLLIVKMSNSNDEVYVSLEAISFDE